MLTIRNITFRMEGKPLLEDASATIPTGHKVGLVGRNGTGKTTLFRLIRGELALDEGSIGMPKAARIGGVAQEVPSGPESLIATVLAADTERAALMAEAETAHDATRIAEIHMRLADIEAHSAEARASSILLGLGFDAEAQLRPCADFSGGWRMRVALAAVLFAQPDLLLLDEPTNYLDLEGAIWLESYLAKYPHTVIIVSHDRDLLNRSVGGILHLDQRKLTYYSGPYDEFVRIRRMKLDQQISAKRKQDDARAHMQAYVDRFRAKASKAKQAQSRLKALSRMTLIDDVVETGVTGFNFPTAEELSPPIIRLDDVTIGYANKPVLRGLDLRIDQDDRIALLGANGQGKSTFAKLLADRLQPMAGRKYASSKLRVGYFAQHQVDELDVTETPVEHLRRLRKGETPGKLRARLGAGGLPPETHEMAVGKLSGGQKARLSLLIATLEAPHLIILDEPTNHLDIESREALVRALTDYSGAVILVSHDPHLVELVAEQLWLVNDGEVKPFDGDMDAYRRFLLSARGVETREKAARKVQASKADLAGLKAELARAEERVQKLEIMRDQIDLKMAEPDLYERGAAEIGKWQMKRAEIIGALDRAEALWAAAQEKLDRIAS